MWLLVYSQFENLAIYTPNLQHLEAQMTPAFYLRGSMNRSKTITQAMHYR